MEHLPVGTTSTEAPRVGAVSSQRFFDGLPLVDLSRLPAVRCEAGWIGGGWLQAASLAGRSHRQNGAPSSGQDVYNYVHTDNGEKLTVLAVADGLGSRPRSHVGATLAVRIACDELTKIGYDGLLSSTDDQLIEAGSRINSRLLNAAGQNWHDVGTTLLACVLLGRTPDLYLIGIRVGDPTAHVLNKGNQLEPLWPGELEADTPLNIVNSCIPNQNDDFAFDIVRRRLTEDAAGIVLLSDGVANDMTDLDIQSWCLSKWTTPLDAFGMVDSLRYQRRGSSDDRTALVLLLDAEEHTTRQHPSEIVPAPEQAVQEVCSRVHPIVAAQEVESLVEPDPGSLDSKLDVLPAVDQQSPAAAQKPPEDVHRHALRLAVGLAVLVALGLIGFVIFGS